MIEMRLEKYTALRTGSGQGNICCSERQIKNAAILLTALLFLCGCSKPADVRQPTAALTELGENMIEVAPVLRRDYPKGDMSALEIERDTQEYNGGYILYPKVLSGTRAEKINEEMCRRIRAKAEEMNAQIFTEYRIEANAAGLFSVLFSILDLNSNDLLDVFPLTFDTASGEVCEIEYYFEPNNEEWRSALAELAEKDAKNKGMSLLGGIPPIGDERDYFINGGKLVLQYHLYEIAVHADGTPQLEIPIGELTQYLAKDSPLLREGL